MGRLIIAGEGVVDLGPTFINFEEGRRWNSTVEGIVDLNTGYMIQPGGCTAPTAKNKGSKRYSSRPVLRRTPNPSLSAVQSVVKKFVLHHDGVNSSQVCQNVLHNERGLSCHFLIDNDGTIYQTLDLALMGYHSAAFNSDSIGVEICNRGILDNPDYYANAAIKHPESDEYFINGHKMKSFDFTQQQYEAFYMLAGALVKHLPNLALEYPRDPAEPSKPAWGTMGPVTAEGDSLPMPGFAGFCGHYHLTTRKWDPGPFDFKKWIDKLRGQRVFPLRVPGMATSADKPIIPENPAELPAAMQPFYDANELNAHAGFFPVGPWGGSRLWHGGVHLPAAADSPVYAPFAGRVIAARMGTETDIGSANFVLMRHDLAIGSQSVRVYSLFMHLADETNSSDPPAWMGTESRDLDSSVGVVGYDAVLDAGSVIGRVGTVGPGDLSAPQIHFEIFSTQRWFEKKDGSGGTFSLLIDGSNTGRFCDDEALSKLIDRDKDGRLSRKEIEAFYEGSDDVEIRDVITLHASEWGPEPDWTEELKSRMDQFQKRVGGPKGKRRPVDNDDEDYDIPKMVKEQLEPFTWWTELVAKELGLPGSAIVYHYHPLRFIEFANSAHSDAQTKVVATERAIDDNDDVNGDFGFVGPPPPPPPDLHLKLENLVDGYEGDVPPP